jgi:hypothetical protein
VTPEHARIRGYLQAQATKLSPPAIVDKVRAAMSQLGAAAAAVPAARFAERPAPEEWSANERLLEADREALFARVAEAEPSARRQATIEHGMFGPLNWRETLLFLRLHDLDHAGQLSKITAALTAVHT